MFRSVFLLMIAIALPSVGAAQNLLVNPEFDTDLTPGWASLTGGFAWNSDDWNGSPTSGSVHGVATEFGAYIRQCVPINAETLYSTGAFFRQIAGTAPSAEIRLFSYSTSDCTGSAIDTAVISGPIGAAWGPVSGAVVTPPGAQSVNVWMGMEFFSFAEQIRIDHAFLVPGLFGDDFESQSPFNWDLVVGNPACIHDICDVGSALSRSCDPCVADICAQDPFCCDTSWDGKCTAAVVTVCGLTCP